MRAALGGIYRLHDQRQNPDTVSAIVQYANWNLNFESSVLSIRDDHPSVFFEGTEGTLDLSRDGYTFTPNQGPLSEVSSTESLERAHTRNFLDAIVSGAAGQCAAKGRPRSLAARPDGVAFLLVAQNDFPGATGVSRRSRYGNVLVHSHHGRRPLSRLQPWLASY